MRCLTVTQNYQENERYIAAGARDLPPPPDALSFLNPSTKEGACGKSAEEIEMDGIQAYEHIPPVPKVANPLYGDAQPTKPPPASYEDIDKLYTQKKEMASVSEYELMNSVSKRTSKPDAEK